MNPAALDRWTCDPGHRQCRECDGCKQCGECQCWIDDPDDGRDESPEGEEA